MIGIYKITNTINNKIYIGQSVNIQRRWKEHRNVVYDNNAHEYDYPLYRAMRKYGIDNFIFEVIEECAVEELNQREQFWIKFYDSWACGYNQGIGGSTPRYQKINAYKLQQIDNLLQTRLDLTQSEIASLVGVSTEMIQGINTGRYWTRDINYPIRNNIDFIHAQKTLVNPNYDTHKGHFCQKCGKPITNKATYCPECAALLTRKAERPDKMTLAKLICENGFEVVGRQYGVSGNAIKKWCDTYNIPRLKKELQEWYKKQNI